LAKCRRNNGPLGITELLLAQDGNFMQLIEGPEQSVRELIAKISRDPRHRGMLTLLDETVEMREFPDWKMGYRDLTEQTSEPPVGYSEFLNVLLRGEEFKNDSSKCQRLMRLFKKNQR
jgi:hypothetical protein